MAVMSPQPAPPPSAGTRIGNAGRNGQVAGIKPSPVPLDDVSKAIIEQLQQDGRRPYATIGEAVGLSEAAVRQRVQRLIRSGVVQIVAVTDPLQIGFTRQAKIGLRAEGNLDPIVAE